MHKNAIKIVWGVKNCAPFTKNMALFGAKNCAPFCALFDQIRCAFEFRIINHSDYGAAQILLGSAISDFFKKNSLSLLTDTQLL